MDTHFFSYQGRMDLLREAIGPTFEKQLDPVGPIASRGGSVPICIRKSIATIDFQGGTLSGSAREKYSTAER